MKNRKYIPKTTDKVVSAMNCFWCIHRNKCINAYRFESKLCLSFQKSAGIKKRIKKNKKFIKNLINFLKVPYGKTIQDCISKSDNKIVIEYKGKDKGCEPEFE